VLQGSVLINTRLLMSCVQVAFLFDRSGQSCRLQLKVQYCSSLGAEGGKPKSTTAVFA
jgi:hypothetical protein